MSRIGKLPITVPSGVDVAVDLPARFGDLTLDAAQTLVNQIKPAEGVVIGSKAPPDRTSAGRAKHIKPEGVAAIERPDAPFDALAWWTLP